MSQDEAIGELCLSPGCKLEEGHVHLLRFSFRLPEPIGVDDGFSMQHIYHPDRPDSALGFAHLTILQVEMESDDPTSLSMRSIERLDRTAAGNVNVSDEQAEPPLGQNYHSVVQIVTSAMSPDQPPPGWNEQMQNLEPREDSFMRALHAAQTLVRGVKLASLGRPPLLPTYERAPLMILVNEMTVEAPLPLDALGDMDWEKSSLMLLHHSNAPGGKPQVVPSSVIHAYGIEIAQGNPAILAKERFIDAKRLIHADGDYSAAVVSAATGMEVLSDALLSALLWEEHIVSGGDTSLALKDASVLFSSDVTPLWRAQTKTVSMLGGNWTSSASPWQVYRGGAAGLRNRIVHAGYQPKRQEAVAAYQQSLDAQTFLLDRLADRRAKYPRTCAVFLGPDGLSKRNLYNGKIKQFLEQTIHSGPPLSASFSAWHQGLVRMASA